MSIFEGSVRSSRISSILKAPSLKSTIIKTPSKVRFKLPNAKKLKKILTDFLSEQNTRDYENLVIAIRDSELLDSDICDLLSEASHCISLLNLDLRLFVEALLSLKWVHRSELVISEYKSFLLNLLCAHNYHAKHAIDKLVLNFVPDSNVEWENGLPTQEDIQRCIHVHWVFNLLIKVVPMCLDLIVKAFNSHFPYHKRSAHTHEYYIHNLLCFLEYQPQKRPEILNLIISKLVVLDVNAPKAAIIKAEENDEETIFAMDADQMSKSDADKVKHPVGHTLDICMDKLLNYLISECEIPNTGNLDWEKTKGLYRDIISIFDKVILPTYNIHHVQFIMFNLCCFKTTLTEGFLNFLWRKVCTPSIASVIRHSAVVYIASFIARSSFVPLSMLKGTLQQMCSWVHMYISAQDELECVNYDVRVHTVFYSVCQAIFYVIAFRQKDLFNGKKNISFLETLNLAKIVACRLNPLRVCQPAVVKNFATVTRTHQLVYCYSVIEHNARNIMPTIYQDEKGCVLTTDNTLDSFFPFDPYVLKRSGKKIWPFYFNYTEGNDEKLHHKQEMEVDDFLCDDDGARHMEQFSYSSSPGFRKKSTF